MLINGIELKIAPWADLQDADLQNADLRGVNLFGADLRHANLAGTDLRDADLRLAQVQGANTKGAKLKNALLPHDKVSRSDGNATVWHHWVDNSGSCRIWTGATNNNHNTSDGKSYNYGVFQLEGCGTQLVHRQVFFMHTGKELPEDVDVSPEGEYGCNNRLCVSPKHLYIGPQGSDKIRMIDFF